MPGPRYVTIADRGGGTLARIHDCKHDQGVCPPPTPGCSQAVGPGANLMVIRHQTTTNTPCPGGGPCYMVGTDLVCMLCEGVLLWVV